MPRNPRHFGLVFRSSKSPASNSQGPGPGQPRPGSPQVPNNGPDGLFLGFDTLRQLELDQGPEQILFPVPDLEIDIALQVVGEESQPQLESEEADGVVQIFIVVPGEKAAGPGEIAPQDGPAEFGLEAHRLPRLDLLSQGIAARTQAVADVIMDQAGLDGVQVHQGDGLSAGPVHHDVVDLGIAVDRAELEPSLRPGRLQDLGPATT